MQRIIIHTQSDTENVMSSYSEDTINVPMPQCLIIKLKTYGFKVLPVN